MASGDRFYMLELRHRPALRGDVGSLLKIEGLVIGGEGTQAVLLLPSAQNTEVFLTNPPHRPFDVYRLNEEQWTDWLQRSDQPEILVPDPTSAVVPLAKVFHRKVRYDISGAVQQKIWAADGFKCVFCGISMGKAQLSIDHWMPLELGGVNDSSNYLSCCKRENKEKGAMHPRDWCQLKRLDYDHFVNYLATRSI